MSADENSRAVGKITSGRTLGTDYEGWRQSIVKEIGVRLDPKRDFDEEQKKEIYSRDKSFCGICREHVEEAEEYDHFPTAWAIGGQTVVDNGRLVHQKCHPRGRPTEEDE